MGVWRFATFSRNARTRACVSIRLSSPQRSASRRAWSPPCTDENGRQSKCGAASLPTLRGTEGSLRADRLHAPICSGGIDVQGRPGRRFHLFSDLALLTVRMLDFPFESALALPSQ